MTTFSDDFVQLELDDGPHRFYCERIGLTWPPPERLWVDELGIRIANHDDPEERVLVRQSMSIITDEARSRMDRVARGSVYARASVSAGA